MNCQSVIAALNSYPAKAAYLGISSIAGLGALAGNVAVPFIQRKAAINFGKFVLQELANNSSELVQNITLAFNSLDSDLKTQMLWGMFLAGLVPACAWGTTRLYDKIRNKKDYEPLGNRTGLDSSRVRRLISSCSFVVGLFATLVNVVIPGLQEKKASDFGNFALNAITKNGTASIQTITREYSKLHSVITAQAALGVAASVLAAIGTIGTTHFCFVCNEQD
jgi:hypothetical protein